MGQQASFWIIMRNTFKCGQVSWEMKSHFYSVQLLTEFTWIIVNALYYAATAEARLVWLQQTRVYHGLNYSASWMGLLCSALWCTAGFAMGTWARSFRKGRDFITELFFGLGFLVKERSATCSILKNKIKKCQNIAVSKFLEEFHGLCSKSSWMFVLLFSQNRVFILLSNYCAETKNVFEGIYNIFILCLQTPVRGMQEESLSLSTKQS